MLRSLAIFVLSIFFSLPRMGFAEDLPTSLPLPFIALPGQPCQDCFDVGGWKTRANCNEIHTSDEISKGTDTVPMYANKLTGLISSEEFLSGINIQSRDDSARYNVQFVCSMPTGGSVAVSISRSTVYDNESNAPNIKNVIDGIHSKYGKPNFEKVINAPTSITYILDSNYRRTSAKSESYYPPLQDMRAVFAKTMEETLQSGVGMSLSFKLYRCDRDRDRICTIESYLVDYKTYVESRQQFREDTLKWRTKLDAIIERNNASQQVATPKL